MPLPTPPQFIQLIQQSRLFDSDHLDQIKQFAVDFSDVKRLAHDLIRRGWLTRWQANQLLTGFTQFELGKYRLIDLIGRGASCNVFRAEHTTMHREVAVKVLAMRLQDNEEAVRRFYDEARIIASLGHRNIVQVYNVEKANDRHVMVMELVDGIDLQRLVEHNGPLPIRRTIDYTLQIASGLAHAHANNWVHCDIKPGNLVVNRQGVVKILDMGTTRDSALDSTENMPTADTPAPGSRGSSESMPGTVDYMAPELALNESDWDHRGDIYSLGATLYYLLTSRPPFPDGSLTQKILKHQTKMPASICELRADAPQPLVLLCNRMLAKLPDDRPESCQEIAAAIKSIAEGLGLK